jgi:hypothetical protein
MEVSHIKFGYVHGTNGKVHLWPYVNMAEKRNFPITPGGVSHTNFQQKWLNDLWNTWGSQFKAIFNWALL